MAQQLCDALLATHYLTVTLGPLIGHTLSVAYMDCFSRSPPTPKFLDAFCPQRNHGIMTAIRCLRDSHDTPRRIAESHTMSPFSVQVLARRGWLEWHERIPTDSCSCCHFRAGKGGHLICSGEAYGTSLARGKKPFRTGGMSSYPLSDSNDYRPFFTSSLTVVCPRLLQSVATP